MKSLNVIFSLSNDESFQGAYTNCEDNRCSQGTVTQERTFSFSFY